MNFGVKEKPIYDLLKELKMAERIGNKQKKSRKDDEF